MKHEFVIIGRKISFFICLLLITVGCEEKEKGDTFTNESVKQVAQHYYTLFAQGDAQRFVEGMANAESFDADYKKQMQNVVTQATKELERKGGVTRVEALSDTLYSSDSTAYVYLDLVFSDSVHEQIGVPMAFIKGYWKMK